MAITIPLLLLIARKALGCPEAEPMERVLAVVQNCMARSPAPWPEAWKREYVDAIRQAIVSHPEAGQYAKRLEILSNGFRAYWEGLKKGQDKSQFEVHRAEIRWYTENLMAADLPGDEETRTLRQQYEDLCWHGASSLLSQFPFLDPNIVQAAKADYLRDCYRHIQAPLLPIFLRPFSQGQMDQIRQSWHDLRYSRVDLWQQLGDPTKVAGKDEDSVPIERHPDYMLTQKSLRQLQSCIWAIGPAAPDYYRSAAGARVEAERRRFQAGSQAWEQERRLQREYSRQLWQTEQISFLLAALLETTQCLEESPGLRTQESGAPQQHPGETKGDDSYEEKVPEEQ